MLTALVSAACSRPLPVSGGARDGGGVDVAPEARPDARDAAADVPAICPAGVAPVNVCGCGCCGPPQTVTCYYPASGESAATIPNPVPPPASCANVGCASGIRHLCCLDPGPDGAGDLCVEDRSAEDLPRLAVIRRDGTVCTTLELYLGVSALLPISGPSAWGAQFGYRGPCDGSSPAAQAIGGAGTLNVHPLAPGSGVGVVDIHAALFFDAGTGTADAVRLDADGRMIGATRCPYGTP